MVTLDVSHDSCQTHLTQYIYVRLIITLTQLTHIHIEFSKQNFKNIELTPHQTSVNSISPGGFPHIPEFPQKITQNTEIEKNASNLSPHRYVIPLEYGV